MLNYQVAMLDQKLKQFLEGFCFCFFLPEYVSHEKPISIHKSAKEVLYPISNQETDHTNFLSIWMDGPNLSAGSG